MTVLITGAAGGVGSFLRQGLPALGWRLRCLDLVRPADAGPGDWVTGDITDPRLLDAALRGVEEVIHLAAIPGEDAFPRLLHANIDGISANTRAWWSLDSARVLGYAPRDDAEAYAAEILARQGEPDPADPELRFAGGRMAAS